MQYPLISEYLAAIRDADDNLDKLSHLVPVLDKYSEPYRSSGAFAVVFKMKDEQTGKYYALKCFTEEQEGRAEAYRQIAEELEFVDSPYITSVKYLEKELFVDSNCEDEEFPVLLMDWIEGETMETYVAANYTLTLCRCSATVSARWRLGFAHSRLPMATSNPTISWCAPTVRLHWWIMTGCLCRR